MERLAFSPQECSGIFDVAAGFTDDRCSDEAYRLYRSSDLHAKAQTARALLSGCSIPLGLNGGSIVWMDQVDPPGFYRLGGPLPGGFVPRCAEFEYVPLIVGGESGEG
jgi:hypothetical protein